MRSFKCSPISSRRSGVKGVAPPASPFDRQACERIGRRADGSVRATQGTSGTGAGKRLVWRFQVEQALHGGGHLLLFYPFWKLLEFAGEEAGNSTSNAVGNFLEHLV